MNELLVTLVEVGVDSPSKSGPESGVDFDTRSQDPPEQNFNTGVTSMTVQRGGGVRRVGQG
jgi:hypothetical protein